MSTARKTVVTEKHHEALSRAETGASLTNYPAIIQGFIEKGIAPSDITPRVNVFTFNAWKAKGRSVKKGEKGVRVVTFAKRATSIEAPDGTQQSIVRRVPSSTVVFHISQTEMMGA
jgi:hypothetical protein